MLPIERELLAAALVGLSWVWPLAGPFSISSAFGKLQATTERIISFMKTGEGFDTTTFAISLHIGAHLSPASLGKLTFDVFAAHRSVTAPVLTLIQLKLQTISGS